MAGAAPKSTAIHIIRRLREAGFEALLAGGCVRDMLLGRPCYDYDVATSATPQDVKKLFGHVLLVGAKFGVAMVIKDSLRVEVATFRSDLSYSDGRRPEGVRFTTAREDALRRDFTINGIFYDPIAEEVIDYVGGRDDLKRKVVRTIGEPRERFAEDYLRMLRAVRFTMALGFELDPAAAEAIRQTAPRIAQISGERIFEELGKMLSQPTAAGALQMLADLGLARHALPELFEQPGVWERAVERVAAVAGLRGTGVSPLRPAGEVCGEGVSPLRPAGEVRGEGVSPLRPAGEVRGEGVSPLRPAGVPPASVVSSASSAFPVSSSSSQRLDLALAALVCELLPSRIADFIRRGGQSNERRELLSWIAAHRSDWRRAMDLSLADFKRLIGHRSFSPLRRLWAVEERKESGKTPKCLRILRRGRTIPREMLSPPPFVTGKDLMDMGLSEGPLLGSILRRLYDAQLNEELAGRPAALAAAREMVARGQ